MLVSEKDTDKAPDAASERPDDPDIIEATIIHETPEPDPASSSKSSDTTSPKKAGMGAGTKLAWGLVVVMGAFGAGVYLAPQFAPGLERLGISLAPPPAQNSAGTTFDSQPLETAMDDLKAAFARQQEILAQQAEDLKAAEAARASLQADLNQLAATGTGGTTAPAVDAQKLAALQSEITRLTDDVARLSTLSGAADPNVTELKGALALARSEAASLKARLKAVEDTLLSVQAGALEASPRGRIVLALGRLKDRALVGQPFGSGLGALRPDFAALPALDQQMIGADLGYLESHGTGVASYDALVAEFDDVAAAAVNAADKADGNFLAGLFSSRRTDAGATGLDAELVKAERLLLARDVAGAVKVLAALEGPALEATAVWRDRAEAYAGVRRAFDRLIERVSSSTVAMGGSGQ
ncbi:hypothetical protein SAMN04488071_0079 [Kordiimonas lacus]|uniref:Inner membrane protein n=1 Tax=Kordiimonas lacus TaxID=637679 RepID=A0A1G6T369_9PROT|nr:hypothetical protein SAMN04488071_0079 [Kordiimonas lacus]